jgi:hypothetical protein
MHHPGNLLKIIDRFGRILMIFGLISLTASFCGCVFLDTPDTSSSRQSSYGRARIAGPAYSAPGDNRYNQWPLGPLTYRSVD